MNRSRGKSRRVGGRSYALPAAARQREYRYVIDRPVREKAEESPVRKPLAASGGGFVAFGRARGGDTERIDCAGRFSRAAGRGSGT